MGVPKDEKTAGVTASAYSLVCARALLFGQSRNMASPWNVPREGRTCPVRTECSRIGPQMSRTSTLPRHLQPMLATLTDAPFDDPGWIFEDKYDGFRMIAEIRRGKVALYSRNGKIISHSYIEVAKALEGVKGDAVKQFHPLPRRSHIDAIWNVRGPDGGLRQ